MTDADLSRSFLVQVLARMPDLRMRTLAEHGPDHAGYCLGCRDRGARTTWPCMLWQIGTAAEGLAHRSDAGHVPSPTYPPPRHRLR